jgi:cell division protein FtsZ
VADAAHPEANIIFGAVIDDTLGDEVRVTVIAAGFDGGLLPSRRTGSKPVTRNDVDETPVAVDTARATAEGSGQPAVIPVPAEGELRREPRTIVFDDAADDDLDVPDFLK